MDRGHVQMMVDRTLEEFGRLDILMNNAAYARGPDRVPILELDPDIFQRVIDIKVTGSYLCTAAAIRPMIDQGEGGKIVNVSSTAGKRGSENTLAYNAANFAMIGMTQSMARELGPHGINVNCVCPGGVDTSRMDDLGRGERWEQMGQWPRPSAGWAPTTRWGSSWSTSAPRPHRGSPASPSTSTAAPSWSIRHSSTCTAVTCTT